MCVYLHAGTSPILTTSADRLPSGSVSVEQTNSDGAVCIGRNREGKMRLVDVFIHPNFAGKHAHVALKSAHVLQDRTTLCYKNNWMLSSEFFRQVEMPSVCIDV